MGQIIFSPSTTEVQLNSVRLRNPIKVLTGKRNMKNVVPLQQGHPFYITFAVTFALFSHYLWSNISAPFSHYIYAVTLGLYRSFSRYLYGNINAHFHIIYAITLAIKRFEVNNSSYVIRLNEDTKS